MGNPISKFYRLLRREYPTSSSFIVPSAALMIGGGVLTVMMAGFAGPLLIASAVMGSLVGLLAGAMDDAHSTGNSENINGCKLVGDPQDIYRVKRVQELIDTWTKKMQHMDRLPEKLNRKIMAHIGDAAEALARVRVYGEFNGKPEETFSFHRNYYNASGRLQTEIFAVVDLKEMKALDVPSPMMIQPPVKQLPPSQNVAPDFTRLSKKVETLEGRLENIENPKPVELDKPKTPGKPEL